jgi:hypothetical protein
LCLSNQIESIMKKLLLLIAMAAVFAACNTTPKVPVVIVDTLAIRQKAVLDEQVRVQAEKDSINRAADLRRERRQERNQSASGYKDAASETPASAAAPAKKKGWSSAAKGTAIGAGVGAIAGGIIGHNLGGAAIGAAAGGGAGYLIGRGKDRKSGRVVKKVDTTKN